MSNFNSRLKRYKTPFGAVKVGEKVTFNFPVADHFNGYGVRFCYRLGGERYSADMTWVAHTDDYTEYKLTISFPHNGIYMYRFEILTPNGVVYCGRGDGGEAIYGEWLPEWQLTVYNSDFKTPDKYKGGVIYHVFVDRFFRSGKVEPDRPLHDDWYETPFIKSADGVYRGDDFFGGDLEGIREKLPYIKSLGANILYLSPIFKSHSNHRYDTGDYLKIDELLGDEEDFKRLCRSAKAQGIYVMLDGVFNHSGSDSLYFNKHGNYDTVGAYQSVDSPYYDWYYFDSFPDDYKSWWGIKNVPTLNKSSAGYRELVLGNGGVIDKWTRAGASMWRLDVVDELPTDFVKLLRKKIKSVKKDALIIGEVWEDASVKRSYGELRPYLFGEELDGVMNYPFMNATLDYANGGSVDDFKESVLTIVENYPKPVIDSVMNFLSTHDTVRAINTLSGVPVPYGRENQATRPLTHEEYENGVKRLKIASVIEYTLPGNPSIFYGDEAGVTGWQDPLNRVTYPWGRENEDTLSHYKALGKMRKSYRDVFKGEIEFLDIDGLLAYKRTNGERSLTVVINNTDSYKNCNIKGTNVLSGKRVDGNISPFFACVVEEEI